MERKQKRKYDWNRGEDIKDTFLRYVCEAGYRGKHRYIFVKCDLCDTIKEVRLESITNGRTKSCGCYHKEMIESGKLTALQFKIRNEKPYLAKHSGGWNWDGDMVVIAIHKRNLKFLKDKTISEFMEV